MGKKSKQNGKPQKSKNLKKVGINSKNESRKFNDTVIKPTKVDASESKKKVQSFNNSPKTIEKKSNNNETPKKITTPNKLSPLQIKMKEQLESSRFASHTKSSSYLALLLQNNFKIIISK